MKHLLLLSLSLLSLLSCSRNKPLEVYHADTKAVMSAMDELLQPSKYVDEWVPLYFQYMPGNFHVYDSLAHEVHDIPAVGYLVPQNNLKRAIHINMNLIGLKQNLVLLSTLQDKQYKAALKIKAKYEKEQKDKRMYQILTWVGAGLTAGLLITIIGISK